MENISKEQQILTAIKRGKTCKEIAKALKITRNTVRYFAYKNNVPINYDNKKSNLSKEEIAELREIQARDPFNMAIKQVDLSRDVS